MAKFLKTYAAAPLDSGKPLAIGGYALDAGSQLVGSMDECRLLGAVPTADWIKAEYDAQANAGFLSFGAATRTPADFIRVDGAPSRYAAAGRPASASQPTKKRWAFSSYSAAKPSRFACRHSSARPWRPWPRRRQGA